MKIGLIGAMQIEMENLQKSMINVTTVEQSGVTFYCGNLEGREDIDIVAAVCGVGKVFSAICAQTMILKFGVDMVINIGVAGGVSRDLKVYDVVAAEKVCQHDMNTTPIGDPQGLLSGINMIYLPTDEKIMKGLEDSLKKFDVHFLIGTVATGDLFVDTRAQRDKLEERFGALAADMESGSIGQVCYVNKVPFGILRSISDADGAVDYMQFAEKAADVAVKVIVDYIKSL